MKQGNGWGSCENDSRPSPVELRSTGQPGAAVPTQVKFIHRVVRYTALKIKIFVGKKCNHGGENG
jgi:hypothetical protein